MDCSGIAGIGGSQVAPDQREPGFKFKKKRLKDILFRRKKIQVNADRRTIIPNKN